MDTISFVLTFLIELYKLIQSFCETLNLALNIPRFLTLIWMNIVKSILTFG